MIGYDVDRLPRYEFTQTHVGCAMHGDPICLCDVDMSKAVTVNAEAVMFGALAKQALQIDTLDDTVVYDWASLMLGMYDAYRNLGDREGKRKEPSFMDGTTAWSRLPDDIRARMVAGYYDKIPWSVASKWLPELDKKDRTSIYKYYNQRLYAKNTQRKQA
jgi:hypothetical protein